MSFECRNAHSSPLFYRQKIIKLPDKILMEKTAYLLVNLFNSIFYQFSIIDLLFLLIHIAMKHLALQKLC